MIRAIPWTWGMGGASTPVAQRNPQWVLKMQGRDPRTVGPRVRGTDLVLPGDFRDPDPAFDTWEGEAT